jgi:hypothetical protein
MVMSDDELTDRQKKMGWTPALVDNYVEQRNHAASKKILDIFQGQTGQGEND